MATIPRLSDRKRSDPPELPTDPQAAFAYASGEMFAQTGIRIEAEAGTDLHGRHGCHLVMSRQHESESHEIFATTEEMLAARLFASRYLLETGEQMIASAESVPEWIWQVYGIGGLLGSTDTTTTEGAEVYSRLMPVYAKAVESIDDRTEKMESVNSTLTQGSKSRAYWLWEIQCLVNVYTGDTRYKFWFQETHPHSPGYGKFYSRDSGRDTMRDMKLLFEMLQDNLPYLATRFLPSKTEIADTALRRTLEPITSPEEPDPLGESPVGKAVEQFIREECQNPAADYMQGFWEDRPYWASPGFQMDGSRHPADYPDVFAYPNTLEVYTDSRSRHFGSTTSLRAAIAAYLLLRYGLESRTDPIREQAVRASASWANLPDAGKVWVLPHPEKTEWESSLAQEFHPVLVEAGLETGPPDVLMPEKISLLLE